MLQENGLTNTAKQRMMVVPFGSTAAAATTTTTMMQTAVCTRRTSCLFSTVSSPEAFTEVVLSSIKTSSWLPEEFSSTVLLSSTSSFPQSSFLLSMAGGLEDPSLSLLSTSSFLTPPPIVLVIVALGLAIAAQGWINSMLAGDRGLGAFLKDGSGFAKSAFRPTASKATTSKKPDRAAAALGDDPLPWLKLPQLDFVEVAGQEKKKQFPKPSRNVMDEATAAASAQETDRVILRLESLRQDMNVKLHQGKLAEASLLRKELEKLMKENGMEYKQEENE